MTGFQITPEIALSAAAFALTAFNTFIVLKIDLKISNLKIWAINRFQQKRGFVADENE